MKYRSGYVSNSSSSSFICDVCNEAIESYDGDNQVMCEKDHCMCEGCASGYERNAQGPWGDPAVSANDCPLCTDKVIPDWRKLKYFYDTLGITSDQAADLVRGKLDITQFFRGITNEGKK